MLCMYTNQPELSSLKTGHITLQHVCTPKVTLPELANSEGHHGLYYSLLINT